MIIVKMRRVLLKTRLILLVYPRRDAFSPSASPANCSRTRNFHSIRFKTRASAAQPRSPPLPPKSFPLSSPLPSPLPSPPRSVGISGPIPAASQRSSAQTAAPPLPPPRPCSSPRHSPSSGVIRERHPAAGSVERKPAVGSVERKLAVERHPAAGSMERQHSRTAGTLHVIAEHRSRHWLLCELPPFSSRFPWLCSPIRAIYGVLACKTQ
ncbi:hypothetical protein EJB05_26071, partial [Eragrostis curvula]